MFTMLIGEVDSVPGQGTAQSHKISTRFFAFVGPLIPFESLCVTQENFERYGNRTTHSYSGEAVRFSPLSILLGYLRVWLGILVFALPFILYWGQLVRAEMFIPSAYALAAWIAVLVVPGLLERGKRKKLAVVRRVVGLGCDPKLRHQFRREETAGELMQQLSVVNLPTDAQALEARVSSMPKDQLELAFVTAWYQRACGKPEWAAPMNAAWAKLAG
ncbi:MAG: hypothetical protein U0228_11580 [Myxococcaceae bacterium]